MEQYEEIKKYEAIIILKPKLSEDETENIIQGIINKIQEKGTINGDIERKGHYKLAYEIKGNKEGYYLNFYFTMPKCVVKEIEIFCRNNENVIKFIIMEVSE